MLKLLLILIPFMLPLAVDILKHEVGALTTFYEQVMPLVIAGEGWSQTCVVQCVEDRPDQRCTGALRFFTREGEHWEIDLVDPDKGDTVLFDLKPGQAMSAATVVKFHPQELGWAEVKLGSGGFGDIFRQTIFRKQQEGRPDLMTNAEMLG